MINAHHKVNIKSNKRKVCYFNLIYMFEFFSSKVDSVLEIHLVMGLSQGHKTPAEIWVSCTFRNNILRTNLCHVHT